MREEDTSQWACQKRVVSRSSASAEGSASVASGIMTSTPQHQRCATAECSTTGYLAKIWTESLNEKFVLHIDFIFWLRAM